MPGGSVSSSEAAVCRQTELLAEGKDVNSIQAGRRIFLGPLAQVRGGLDMSRRSIRVCVLVGLLSIFLCLQSVIAGTLSSSHSNDEARIARIENGLLPGIAIKGQPLPKLRLADRMKYYNVAGVSIAFFGDGKILWTRTYGYADIAEQKPVTPETLFQAGSISKPTTTLAALRLVQDGKLGLDEDVNSRLTEWAVPENEFTRVQKVTLRRLVSHTAGLNVHGFDGYASGEPVPTVLQVLNGEKPANTPPIRVETVPGTTWRYSGGGYTILQLLLTETQHKPFPQILHDLVLRPAGMTHSTFQQPLPESRRAESATPYRGDGKPVDGGFHTYPEMAAAGLWTTPSDLSLMAIEVQKEHAGESNKILSKEMARQMLSPQKDHWGLGFAIGDPGPKLLFGHGGSDEGFESRLEAYTELGQGIAIMTNGARGDELIREVLCAVAEEYGWPDFHPDEHVLAKIPPRLLSAYSGTYQLPDGSKLVVRVKDGQAYLDGMTPDALALMPESETNFFILTNQITFQFQTHAGAVTALTVYDGGEVRQATKLTK